MGHGESKRLEKLVNKYERGQIQRVDWLDRLAFKAMEKIKEQEKKTMKVLTYTWSLILAVLNKELFFRKFSGHVHFSQISFTKWGLFGGSHIDICSSSLP
ncbi:unnamed protein product [Cuscuta epithymum]|uniref:Uncharacterized protein n=1 Tax=Cuscuta epithymum TaxID=186058 RepID=A0AAV0DAI1_9ASTE|nr:unnamed protein product [Cuscuta epithymum]